MVDTQKHLQDEIDKYKQVQKEYHKALTKRQQLDGQLNENTVVQQELELLQNGNDVYKLIGPVLVKQELIEAKENIQKRIKFITSEMKQTEGLILSLDEKKEVHRENLEKLQLSFHQAQVKTKTKA
ncbi:prefoldin subunit 6 [Copidosoma floridanum]|uniref:prefoldin subunit 6 n=1 Tax=Copidosoma floridanum TaxID=29053 RepID=UPI0006C9B605|nr:prefoldin subunit 6 [Copidosoma floridanum]